MFDALSLFLFAAAATGLLLLAVQLITLRLHLRRPPIVPRAEQGISILKPLCGIDDDLEANLEHFATLDYPNYELLLGVRSIEDPAWPIALACARRHPDRVWVYVLRWSVLQRKMVGVPVYCAQLLLNPIFLGLLGLALSPSLTSLALLGGTITLKIGIDALAGLQLRGGFPLHALAAIPLKDTLAAWAWLVGLVQDKVEWRGNKLLVLEGTRLATPAGLPLGEVEAGAAPETI